MIQHTLHDRRDRRRPIDNQLSLRTYYAPLHFLAARSLLGLRRHADAKVHLAALLEDKRTSTVTRREGRF